MRLRLLSFRQLHELLFRDHHPSLTRRRLRALRDAGWLVFWDGPRRRRRAPRFALPSRRTLAAVLPYLANAAAGESFAGLVRDMIPRNVVRPLSLATGEAPKWLRHQVEVNNLVTRIAASTRKIRWASAWDTPFPLNAGIALPQPDYVLVEELDEGGPRIVFGEHDRGTEPIDRFIARKIALYADLAAFPEITTGWFGTAPFVVHVSVIDAPTKQPMRRLRALFDAAALSPYPNLFRFTLGGWRFAYPDRPVFFGAGREPTRETVHWQDHPTIAG